MSDRTDVDATVVWPEDADDVDEGMVATWFVREGARVEEGQTCCEIQVEKVSVDVPAPAPGTLSEIVVGENEEFTRDDVIGRIDPE